MKQLQPIGHSMQACNLLKCPKWSKNFKWTSQLTSKTLNMDYDQTPNRNNNRMGETHYGDPLWDVTLYYFLKICMFECIPLEIFERFSQYFCTLC